MDQGVIQNFKCKYRAIFIQSLSSSDCSVQDFQRQFNIKDAIFAAAVAWNGVKSTTLHRGWRKLWPKLFSDDQQEEDENEHLSEQPRVVSLITTDSSHRLNQISEDELIDWMEIDNDLSVEEELTDEVIIQNVLRPQEPQETESDEEEPRTTHVTWDEASEALNTFLKFAEANKFYDVSEVMNLHIIKNNFCKKRANSKKQIDIATMFRRMESKKPSTSSLEAPGTSCSRPTTSISFHPSSTNIDSD